MLAGVPETRYAKSGDIHIAYQVWGAGPRNLVFLPGWISHVELMWEEAATARFFERLAAFATGASFDKRGTGLSDPVPLLELPTLEQRMDDVRAVMDVGGHGPRRPPRHLRGRCPGSDVRRHPSGADNRARHSTAAGPR